MVAVTAMYKSVRRRTQRIDVYQFRRKLNPLVMTWYEHRLMIELDYSTLYLLSEMDKIHDATMMSPGHGRS